MQVRAPIGLIALLMVGGCELIETKDPHTGPTDTDTVTEETGTTPDPDDVDDDGDGFAESEGDCDDTDAAISPDADEVCDSIDNDCTGYADDGLSWRQVVTTDDDGNPSTANDLQTLYYDPAFTPLRSETDLGEDGTVDATETYTYSGALLTNLDEDTDGDGSDDLHQAWTYDTSGRETGWTLDADGDGSIDVSTTTTYSTAGNVLTETLDADGVGPGPRSITTYSYDGSGFLVRVEVDADDDTTIDEVTVYTNDASGQPLTIEIDFDNDGQVDTRIAYTYDASGNVETYGESTWALGLGLFIEYFAYTATYDAFDHVLTYEVTTDLAGLSGTDSITYTYQPGADGEILTQREDDDADGNVDRHIAYTYDTYGYGLLLQYSVDEGDDSTIDYLIDYAYTYDSFIMSVDEDGDGTYDYIETWLTECWDG